MGISLAFQNLIEAQYLKQSSLAVHGATNHKPPDRRENWQSGGNLWIGILELIPNLFVVATDPIPLNPP